MVLLLGFSQGDLRRFLAGGVVAAGRHVETWGWWQCRRTGTAQVKGMMRIISVLTVRRAATLESSRPHLNVGHQTY